MFMGTRGNASLSRDAGMQAAGGEFAVAIIDPDGKIAGQF
jgi:hypothetical protein